MLYRKIEQQIREYLSSRNNKVLLIEGARQVGKSFIIRHVCEDMYENYIEVNMVEDHAKEQSFANVRSVDDFYFVLSILAGDKLKNATKENTVIFLDEIQEYPQLLTLLKFLNADGKYTFIASGSLLGVTLKYTTSVPVGSLRIMSMYPLDFEEFLLANNFAQSAIDTIKAKLQAHESLPEMIHNKVMDLFRKYLIVGGMPDAVNEFIQTKNIVEIRAIHQDIIRLYTADASKYDEEKRLNIKRIYDLIPSNMENKKKRVILKDIEDKRWSRFSDYTDEFEYLISSGIALEVMAISNPKYPLAESMTKNLLKLYLNDVGLLTSVLYGTNIMPIINEVLSVNLGSVYENMVAGELSAHGRKLFYYDNKKQGEVDFIINDTNKVSVVPIEVKSGKDYTVHSSINRMVNVDDYGIATGYVLSNNREITQKGKVVYMPIYATLFI
jgi:predicted AAA+ superfamily ATPase